MWYHRLGEYFGRYPSTCLCWAESADTICSGSGEARMFCRAKVSGSNTYIQIVENHREGKKVRQRVIATLGRLDHLQESGALDRLLQSAG